MKKIPNNSKIEDWIATAEEHFPKDEESNYDFALFFIPKNADKLYIALKKHSICENVYISQIVKIPSVWNNYRAMSICSKILLK